MLPVWAKYLDRPFIPAAQAATIGQVLKASVQCFNYVRLTEEHINSLERKYRVTATTRYGWEAAG